MKTIKGLKVLEKTDFDNWCPSFYATHPKYGVSDRYAFLNTRDIAMQLWSENWYPVYAREMRSIDKSNKGFTKHIVRWANPDLRCNGERIELVGVNSHNRSAAFNFMAGIFRLVCTNGLIVQTSNFGSFKVKHVGNIEGQVQSAIAGIADAATSIASTMEDYKTITLTPDEQGVYASAAHSYVYQDIDNAPIQAHQLLRPRRAVDMLPGSYDRPKDDLWSTFNVVQENVLKGGLRGRNTKNRRMKTRQIKSIDKDVKLNKALWTLTEKMAEIKKTS